MNYYIMAKQFATFKGAPCDNGNIILSGTNPDFDGETIDLSQMEDIDEMTAEIDKFIATPTDALLIEPRWFGKHLHENHQAFKPQTETNQQEVS